jgi:hypothetical protein
MASILSVSRRSACSGGIFRLIIVSVRIMILAMEEKKIFY